MKKYEEYKMPELAFFGLIPEHWKVSRMKNAAQIVLGKMLTPEDKGDYQLKPYLKSKNIGWGQLSLNSVDEMWFSANELETYRVKQNDLLVSEGGEVGKTCIWADELDECYIQNSVHKVTVFPENDPRFFLYYLNYLGGAGYFKQAVNQVSIAHLTKEKLMQTPCLTPPLPEQRAIAAYLDHKTAQLDTLLAQKEALLQMLHQKRQALINEAVTQGLDPDAPRKPSGVEWLGDVPAHWETTQLKHVTDFINGAPFKPENWVDEGIPIVRIQNLNGNVNFNCIAPQTEVKESCHLYGGELLFSWSGNVGTSFGPFMWEREGLSYLNQHIFKLANYQLHQKYFYWLLKAVTKYIESKTHGIIGMVHVTKPELGAVPIPMISFEEQGAIADYLDHKMGQVDDVATAIHTQIKTLKAYRQSLISEVVTGKVDVRTAEAVAPEADLPLWRQ